MEVIFSKTIAIIEKIGFITLYTLLFFIIKNYRKDTIFVPTLLFITECFLVFNLKDIQKKYETTLSPLIIRSIYELINSLFSFAELLFFYLLLSRINNINFAKRLVKPIIIAFLVLTIIYYYTIITMQYTLSSISAPAIALNIIEYGILLYLCIYSYYTIMQNPIDRKPINIYNLWTLNSLFLYLSISLPIIIISGKIKPALALYKFAFAIHYFTLLLLILSLIFSVKNKSF